MANDLLKRIVMILVLSISSFSLFAFDKKFEQKLSWTGDENAFEYKIEICRNDSDFVIKSITTTENFIIVNLASGLYKYRVIAYDFLQRESSSTEWCNFEILKAYEPEVELSQTEFELTKKEKKNFNIPLEINQITEESKVELVNIETGEVIEGKIVASKNENEEEQKHAEFTKIDDGEYQIKVINPSGLSKTAEENLIITSKVKPKKEINWPIDLNVTGGVGFDLNVQKAFNGIDDKVVISPLAKVSYLPLDIKKMKFGLELNGQYMNRKIETQYYSFSLDYIIATFSVIGRYNFLNGILGFNVKAGGGLMLCNFDFKYKNLQTSREGKTKQSALESCLTAGVSLNVIFAKYIFIEAGADFIEMFLGSANEGFICPYISAGVRF